MMIVLLVIMMFCRAALSTHTHTVFMSFYLLIIEMVVKGDENAEANISGYFLILANI